MFIKDKNKYKAVVIGGSAGSFPVVSEIFSKLKDNFHLPIFLAPHRLKHVREGFSEALSTKSNIPIIEPFDKDLISSGKVYLAPSNYHMSVENDFRIALSVEDMVWSSRPSIDITLSSCAHSYKDSLVGIILTGANRDGSLGMKDIKDNGGLTIIQDPATCMVDTMPKAAQEVTTIDHIFNVEQIIEFLNSL